MELEMVVLVNSVIILELTIIGPVAEVVETSKAPQQVVETAASVEVVVEALQVAGPTTKVEVA